eukprot:g8230.t1
MARDVNSHASVADFEAHGEATASVADFPANIGVVLGAGGDQPGQISQLWSRSPANIDELALFMTFTLAGRGLKGASTCERATHGVWLNGVPVSPSDEEGTAQLAGRWEKFRGLGVIMDLCAEGPDGEHNIRLVQNPHGDRSLNDIIAWGHHCRMPDLRWETTSHGDIATFSIKIMIAQNMAFVMHDVTATNVYAECVTQPIDGGSEALQQARLGFTSSSGGQQRMFLKHALAHSRWDHPGPASADSGAPEASLSAEEMEEQLSQMKLHEWASEQRLQKLEQTMHASLEQRLDALEVKLKGSMGEKLATRLAALETQLKQGAEDTMNQRVSALETQFRDDVMTTLSRRIEAIEGKVKGQIQDASSTVTDTVDVKLSDRLVALEESMKSGLQEKVAAIVKNHDANTKGWVNQLAQKLENRANDGVNQLKQHASGMAQQSASGWQLPFAVLLVIVVAGSLYFFREYNKMKKRHLL